MCGTYAYLDNITVSGNNTADHGDKLKALLNAAKREGLTINDNKCIYNQTEINLLRYRITHSQIRPDPERLRPLLKMPLPQCKTELQRVLGMFSYYARWIPNFSSKIKLLKSNVNSFFPLSSDTSRSFSTLRSDLAAACVSCIQEGVSFVLECDASESALAATLNQGGKPVAFHSRTFSKSEARYSTVEKEAIFFMESILH